jgi:hypothetical protein
LKKKDNNIGPLGGWKIAASSMTNSQEKPNALDGPTEEKRQ